MKKAKNKSARIKEVIYAHIPHIYAKDNALV